MIGKLTEERINKVTLYADKDGSLIGCIGEPRDYTDLHNVGTVHPDFANLISNAARLHMMLSSCINGTERILEILENEGLDRAAGNLSELIGSMKLIQKCSIDGPGVLTAVKPTAK